MAVDSGTYDDATLQRRYAMAQALMQHPTPIKHWAEGLGNMAETALGGYQLSKLDAERKAEKAKGQEDLTSGIAAYLNAARGGASSPAPMAPPVVQGAQPSAVTDAPAPLPIAPATAPMATARPEVMASGKVWGDKEAEDAGLYEKPPATVKMAQALNAPPSAGNGAVTSDERTAAMVRMLNSSNPTARALGTAMFSNVTKQDTPINVGGKLVTPTGKVVYDGGEEKPKWGVVGKDKYGQPVYGYPPSREDAAKAAEKPAAAAPDMAGITGKDYLDTLKKDDPKMESQVRAVIEGRTPYPTGMLLKTPYGQQLAAHVTQADPSFESGNATARTKTRNEFMTGGVGSPAGQITAGNTALQHAGEMSDALERMKEGGGVMRGLGNAGLPVISYAANQLKNKSVQGTPEGAALNDFMTAKNHFSEEVTKFYAGSAGSEAERTRALANLDAAKSLPELRSAIKTEVNLMQGKVNALQDRWKNGMGPLVPEFPLIQPKSQEAIDRVIKRHEASTAGAAPAAAPGAAPVQTATNPQTGEKLMLQNGQWVPMK